MTEPGGGTGSYSITRRSGELERLALQGAVLAPETERLLDAIGVAEGWACLDLGCLGQLAAAHAAAKAIDPQKALDGMPIPLHPGAERYYKEAGLLK